MTQFIYTGILTHDTRHILCCKMSRRLEINNHNRHDSGKVNIRYRGNSAYIESDNELVIVEHIANKVISEVCPEKRPSSFAVELDYRVPYRLIAILSADKTSYNVQRKR